MTSTPIRSRPGTASRSRSTASSASAPRASTASRWGTRAPRRTTSSASPTTPSTWSGCAGGYWRGARCSRSACRGRRSSWSAPAARWAALADGVGANLGGGTHHAFADGGRGFCVFNDVVVAVRALRRAGRVERVLVVDLDVHQGDGTHAAFMDDPEAFTFSVNGFRNYPFRRVPGDLELDLADGTGDERYLEGLERLLPQALARSRPDVCFYLAGADPYERDRLGRLALSRAGLAARDELVWDTLARAGVATCVTLAGGYADPIEDTVEINLATLRAFAA
jgi:acetoin utilization deacetylase AcuC-like enzyme